MYPETQREILNRIERDYHFKIKDHAEHQRGGICPSCGKKELWTYTAEPWVLICPRLNHCGEQFHVRDLYPDLFENWEKRFQATEQNPTATADAYLNEGRGFDLETLKGLYSQEYFKKDNIGSVTVRFPIDDDPSNIGYWQRILDDKGILPKTTFQYGWSSQGHGWCPPNLDLAHAKEIWITEGIFDTIALWQAGLTSLSALSCNNYPNIILERIAKQCADEKIPLPILVWAFDADQAGKKATLEHIAKATADGWVCYAAQPPQCKHKTDWNDLYKQDRLSFHDLENYRYYGALLIAEKPLDKALLIYNRTGKINFPFDFDHVTYWFKIDMDKVGTIMADYDESNNQDWLEAEREKERQDYREKQIKNCSTLTEIMDCKPQALYWQCNEETDEQWYYFRINFPRQKKEVKATFTGGQLASSAEFKKRLLSIAPGVVYTGTGNQLDHLLKQWTKDIKRVQIMNYVGYHAQLKTYVLGETAVQNGKIYHINDEDYFELPKNTNLKAQAPFDLSINTNKSEYQAGWIDDLIEAYGTKGLISLTAFVGSLFAQQIRKEFKSYPFIEIVGEAGTGKSTLIQFLWKLFGRANFEGEDPNKTSKSGLTRTFRQVSNLPVVLIESDRKGEHSSKQFNWDTIKTLYDGGSLGALGVKNNGNETYNPPFMGTVVISQNAEILASEAIMGRIVHLGFTKDQLSKQTLSASRRLSKYELEDVSYFTLACLSQEKAILETFHYRMAYHDKKLHQDYLNIKSSRIIHNHAQLMALFDALTEHVLKIDPNICTDVLDELTCMAQQRDKVLQIDAPIVQNFWDVYEEIEANATVVDGSGKVFSKLNHHAKPNLIAINFAQLYQVANELRYNLPDIATLQEALRHSQHYRFLEANKAVSSRLEKRSLRCWIFEKPTGEQK